MVSEFLGSFRSLEITRLSTFLENKNIKGHLFTSTLSCIYTCFCKVNFKKSLQRRIQFSILYPGCINLDMIPLFSSIELIGTEGSNQQVLDLNRIIIKFIRFNYFGHRLPCDNKGSNLIYFKFSIFPKFNRFIKLGSSVFFFLFAVLIQLSTSVLSKSNLDFGRATGGVAEGGVFS